MMTMAKDRKDVAVNTDSRLRPLGAGTVLKNSQVQTEPLSDDLLQQTKDRMENRKLNYQL